MIKFSHIYYKMPLTIEHYKTIVLDVFVTDLDKLPSEFLKYDTAYWNEKKLRTEHYKFNFKKAIVIVLFSTYKYPIYTDRRIWTTIRRWTEQKERYYKELIGKEVMIRIVQTPKQPNAGLAELQGLPHSSSGEEYPDVPYLSPQREVAGL